ncbi:MAG: alkaline phosphatase family protein [Acidobacteriota bacterium]|nr:MAG: alkaline phosphatase family protein [Acidobacteriota bacterium]
MINRRIIIVTVLLCLMLITAGAQIRQRPRLNESRVISRIAFGSCATQDRPQPIWDSILATRPEIFLFIGDNIYGDTEDMSVMRAKYDLLDAIPGFRRLSRRVPILATWDDHDYGLNDGGANYPKRAESQQVMLDFFGIPAGSPRRSRAGVYHAVIAGPAGKRVQFILLDTRYHRSPLKPKPPGDPTPGRYVPDDDPDKTMLGDEQWQWLAEQLRQPAELRIIASSIQVVAEDHGWEKWMNLPRERERLFRLIRDTGVVFISGDRHLAELSMMDGGTGYPVYDLTASGMNNASHNWRAYETNRHRVGTMNWGDNFGLITIDWKTSDPLLSLQIRDADGEINIQRKFPLSLLGVK